MIRLSGLSTNLLIRAVELTNCTLILPLLIFYPTSRCNSRCVSCDWWKSTGEDDLTMDEIATLTRSLPALGTRAVAFSGGEPLLRPEVFAIAGLFRQQRVTLQLLTSGILLQRHAREVADCFTRVTISLDASTQPLYQAVRGVAALEVVEAGVARLKALAPRLPVTARSTLHKANYRELPRLVEKAQSMCLDGISFLAADVSSTAFGRRHSPNGADLKLEAHEIDEFRSVIEGTIATHAEAFRSGFIAERPEKLRQLPLYYAALRSTDAFPPVSCNAPWVSAVVEANGAVRPCFFHPAIGNIRQKPLVEILRRDLPAFRRDLDVSSDPICERCVCSIKVGLGSDLCR